MSTAQNPKDGETVRTKPNKGYSIHRIVLHKLGLVRGRDVVEAVRRAGTYDGTAPSVLYELDWMRDGR